MSIIIFFYLLSMIGLICCSLLYDLCCEYYFSVWFFRASWPNWVGYLCRAPSMYGWNIKRTKSKICGLNRCSVIYFSMRNACCSVRRRRIRHKSTNPTCTKAQLRYDYVMYCQISNIRCTKSQNLNVSGLVLQLSSCDLLKPGVKSRMKMKLEQRRQAMLQLHLSDQQFYRLLRCALY